MIAVSTLERSTNRSFFAMKQGASVWEPEYGFDLWWTQDGAYFSEVDQQGFEDGYNMGVRTLVSTPLGLFLGSANPFFGLNVYKGANTHSRRIAHVGHRCLVPWMGCSRTRRCTSR